VPLISFYASVVQIVVFWTVMPCSFVGWCPCFREIWLLQLPWVGVIWLKLQQPYLGNKIYETDRWTNGICSGRRGSWPPFTRVFVSAYTTGTAPQPRTKSEHSPAWKSENVPLHKLCNTVKVTILQVVMLVFWKNVLPLFSGFTVMMEKLSSPEAFLSTDVHGSHPRC
jgi:hypothetical protein